MGRLSKNTRELLVKTYTLKKKETEAMEPTWTLLMENGERKKDKDELEYAHKKRDVLQKAISNREKTCNGSRNTDNNENS